MNQIRLYPIAQAILAAALFGASAPLAKLLLGEIQPIPLAALLYLGSGLGLMILTSLQRVRHPSECVEARLGKADIPWLTGAVLAGGVAAPIVLLFSLRSTPAATASLLLNFEGVATTLIAALAFKEAIGRRVWWAIALVTIASVLLSWDANGNWSISLGAIGILAACVLWGLDNNLIRNVSAKDPFAVVTIKGTGAGVFSLVLALILHSPFPNPLAAAGAMLLGSVSYGLSIVLFVLALRSLGSARTSAWYAIAPFAGAALSLLLFREFPGILAIISLPFMVMGAVLLVGEDHTHDHVHLALEHAHNHCHEDEHHLHEHPGKAGILARSHSHLHRHETVRHHHPHTPDIHHRHGHPEAYSAR